MLGAVGVVLNQVFIWPQVLRGLRTVEGVAALTVLGGLLARAAWTVYGAALGDLALVLGNVTVTVGFLLLLVLLARAADRPLPLVAGGAAVGLPVLAASLAGGAVLGWTAVVTAAVVNLPQMVRALLDPHRLEGVSVPTYLLIAAASSCWLLYGVVVREPLISAPHYVLLPTALVVAGGGGGGG
ncbi:MAG: PQ-loop domain-containing transporter, partial [Actinomycetota bacterium]|nr:PQ-loop domain-containing transporter [Actinomycetota bacterium]